MADKDVYVERPLSTTVCEGSGNPAIRCRKIELRGTQGTAYIASKKFSLQGLTWIKGDSGGNC